MTNHAPHQDAPAGWLDALARSKAQIADGQVVSGDEVMKELHEAVSRMEARHASEPKRKTSPRR